jgi:hypothetical protein
MSAVPSISKQWCVGDVAVPFMTGEGLLDEGGDEVVEFLEVDMTSRSGNFRWVEVGLGLPARSWRKKTWPFLDEVVDALRQRRVALKGKSKPSPATLAVLEVRGVPVMVRSNVKALKVCFRPESLPESLRKFLAELVKDAAKQPEKGGESQGSAPLELDDDGAGPEGLEGVDKVEDPEAPAVADTCASTRASAVEAEWRKANLELLRGHENCASAVWAESRWCFVVKRKSGERFEARVGRLKKLRRDAENQDTAQCLQALEDAYDRAVREGLRRLEAQVSTNAASSMEALEG